MKKIKLISMTLLLAISNSSMSYETSLFEAELDAYDKKTNQVTVNGVTYLLKIDVEKSSYDDSQNALKLIKSRDIKVGETYYFNVYASEKKNSTGFDQVIFIAEEEPDQ